MPTNNPTQAGLVEAVREFLEDKLKPSLDDSELRFKTAVAINALKIVERELASGERQQNSERMRLQSILGDEGSLLELNTQLVAQIEVDGLEGKTEQLLEHFKLTVLDKLAIDNPKYSTYQAYMKTG